MAVPFSFLLGFLSSQPRSDSCESASCPVFYPTFQLSQTPCLAGCKLPASRLPAKQTAKQTVTHVSLVLKNKHMALIGSLGYTSYCSIQDPQSGLTLKDIAFWINMEKQMFVFNQQGHSHIDFLLGRPLGLDIQCSRIYMATLLYKKKSERRQNKPCDNESRIYVKASC